MAAHGYASPTGYDQSGYGGQAGYGNAMPMAQPYQQQGYGQMDPSQGQQQPGQNEVKLYIGNLSPRVTEYMLQEIFSVAGAVSGVKIIPDRNYQHGGLNYGFVEYYDTRCAETALQTLNGRKIFDTEVRVNWAYQNSAAKEDLTNHLHVFVGDLSPEVNDEVLGKAFVAFGSLSDARVMWDMNSGKSRGYGFLAFRDKTDAEQAIATMNGEWLGSRAIRVNWANQKNAGLGGPGGAPSPGGMGGGAGGGMGGTRTFSSAPQSYEQVVSQTSPQHTTVYCGNLVPFVTQQDLLPLFSQFGYIVEMRVQSDRGFAFVKMDSHENAAMAIVNLHGSQVHGRALKCSWGKDREIGGGGGGGGGAAAPPAGGYGGYGQQPQQQYNAYAQYPNYYQQPGATPNYYQPQPGAADGSNGYGAYQGGQPQYHYGAYGSQPPAGTPSGASATSAGATDTASSATPKTDS